jgi:hypothetical protein
MNAMPSLIFFRLDSANTLMSTSAVKFPSQSLLKVFFFDSFIYSKRTGLFKIYYRPLKSFLQKMAGVRFFPESWHRYVSITNVTCEKNPITGNIRVCFLWFQLKTQSKQIFVKNIDMSVLSYRKTNLIKDLRAKIPRMVV